MQSCHLSILAISILSSSVRLEHAPVITLTPKDSFPNYTDLELFCQADGDPVPDIAWFNGETNERIRSEISAQGRRSPAEITTTDQKSRLLIQYHGVDNEFVVYCTASNALGQSSSPRATIGRAYISSSFITEPQVTKKPLAGHTMELSCSPPKGRPPPVVTWLKNGVSLDNARYSTTGRVDNNGTHISTLRIANFRPDDDAGVYRCRADNSYGFKRSSNVFLSLRMSPEIVKVGISSTVNISCPIATIVSVDWFRHDNKKMDSSRVSIGRDRLLIVNVKLSDSGLYVCQATLKSGTTRVSMVNVTVQPPGTFLVTPEDKSVLEGDDVVFKCVVSEYSSAKVYWEIAGYGALFPNVSTHDRYRVTLDNSLHISSAHLTDTGKYTCNYHSSLDAIHVSAHLIVKRPELAHYLIISLAPQNQTLLKGSTATFRCDVVSHMTATIAWYRGEKYEPMAVGGRVSLPIAGVLQIRAIIPNVDSNIYTCEASLKSARMKTRWTASLKVIDPDSGIPVITPQNDENQLPLPPVPEPPYNKTSDSVTLSWTGPSVGSKYWIEYVRFGSPDGWIIYKTEWPHLKITIQNLKPNSWYQFVVRARSSKGLSRASVPTEYVKTLSQDANGHTSKLSLKEKKLSLFSQIQLNVIDITPMGLGKVEMKWDIRVPDSLPLTQIEGFKVRYNVIPLSRCFEDTVLSLLQKEKYCSLHSRSDNDIKAWILRTDLVSWFPASSVHGTVTTGIADIRQPIVERSTYIKTIITGLSPFTCYEMAVDAYSESGTTSPESASRVALTAEEVPSKAPYNIKVFWSKSLNVLTVQWHLPLKFSWNGILTGFIVHIFVNESQTPYRTLRFNHTALNIDIENLDQSQRYSLDLSLCNCHGNGVRSQTVQVPLKLATSSAYEQQPWFIPVIVVCSLVIWILLCCLVVYLCCVRFKFISNGPKFKSKNQELHLRPLITCSANETRFGMGMSKNGYDMNKNASEAVYSEPTMISQSHMTPCSNSSSACTFYASTSIVDPDDNSFAKFYSSPLMDDLGPVSSAILPQYLAYPPHYAAYSHLPGILPFSNTSNNLHNIMNSTSLSHNMNSPLYNVKDENHPTSNVQHCKYNNQSVAGNNWPASVKMGVGQLGGSASATSSSGSGVQKKPVDTKIASLYGVNCVTVSPATFGSATSSPSVVTPEYADNDGLNRGNESPKSTILYDVIPNGETGDDYSQSSDDHNYDSGNDIVQGYVNRTDVASTLIDETDDSQHSPAYSTDSITYSAVPHRPYPKSDRKKQMRTKYPGNIGHKSNS